MSVDQRNLFLRRAGTHDEQAAVAAQEAGVHHAIAATTVDAQIQQVDQHAVLQAHAHALHVADRAVPDHQAFAPSGPDGHIAGHHAALAGAFGPVVGQRRGLANLAQRMATQVQRDVVAGDHDRTRIRIMCRPFDAFTEPVMAGLGDDQTFGQVFCGDGVHAVLGA